MECPSCAAPIDEGADVCLRCGRSLSTLALGSILANRYELRAVLGKGGMGLVYRAFDRLLEEDVAIKVLRTDLSANADAVRRFRGEIKLARKVSHPNVCRIHDYGEEGPLGYISMEILSGQDLQKALKEQPHGLPEAEALSAVLQIASGLQAIHDVGILHRDLKTANATRDERGVVRLVDFGIAKDLLSQGQTAAGEAFGTPEYMSPEQCRGEALDFRSDVYALGILAFELFTGDVPIKGASPMATLFKQIQDSPSFDAEPGSRVPRRFVPALKRALAKAAADRFPSAQEFAQALRSAAVSDPPVTSPTAPAQEIEKPHWVPGQRDARKDERIYLPTDVVLKKLGPGDQPEKEERTVAHDLSRSGMRILTSWSDLEKGDKVKVVEVGGDFSTGAIVRNVNRGTDHITRVGIEFLDNRAPDRLVGTDKTRRGPRTSGPHPPVQARNSGPSAVVSTPPSATPPRPTPTAHPTAHNHVSSAPPHRSQDRPSGGRATVGTRRGPTGIREEIAKAKKLIGESRIWEALQALATAQELAQGTPEATPIRIMIGETQALNPALLKAAQQNLEDLARNEPHVAAVHAALGRIYWSAGLAPKAIDAFGRVLAIEPDNREAIDALAALRDFNSNPR
ncbi:MAG: protein kinase [Vicinamibacteria bacterium]|nr:protein kinase [Vicinamibacteria bacterium]